MKAKSKSFSSINTTTTKLPKVSLASTTKVRDEIKSFKQNISNVAIKSNDKKLRSYGKQNIETSNVPSPQNNIKNKTYKPKLRKSSKLGLQNTHSGKKQDLLDSLLYGQVDLTYSQDFHQKEQQSDQLLIEGCDNNAPTLNFKYCKNLSPIKSISQYSVTQNQHQIFIVQKIDSKSGNAVLKIKYTNLIQSQNKQITNCVLYRRLLMFFKQKKQGLLKFYITIRQIIAKQDFHFKMRQFLFQNAIIFNKIQLNQFIEQICKIILEIHKDTKQHQFCQQNMQILMQKLFLHVNKNSNQLTQNLWISQDIFQKIFEQRDIVSIWKLITQLLYEVPKEIQASFRQSRFCLSMDSTLFIHETDQKRKQQTISAIQKWLLNYLISSQYNTKPALDLFKQINKEQIKIKVIPPLENTRIN